MSYRYYLIIFFDGQKPPYDRIGIEDVYGRHWRFVTQDRGAYFIPFALNRDYQRCGIELPQQGYPEGKEMFLSSIQRMLIRENFLRLERSQKFDHLGMGEMPKLAVDSHSNN